MQVACRRGDLVKVERRQPATLVDRPQGRDATVYTPNMIFRGCCNFILVSCSLAVFGQSNPYYAGNESPLVRMGAHRVLKTINYPEWFQYPAIPNQLRQQLVDSYSTREFLLSFDRSAENAPATKYNEAAQLILDLLGTSTYGAKEPNGAIREAPTRKEINETIKNKLVPQLVKPREGYELDSPSSNETDYDGQNGDEIKRLDKDIAYLARHNNIPTGYRPPSSSMSPSERQAWQGNQDHIAVETRIGSGKGTARTNCPPEVSEQIADAEDRLATFCPLGPGEHSSDEVSASRSCTRDYQKLLVELRKSCR